MTKRPYFSIIIPAKNEEKYISKTLLSLKKQNFKDFEVIVIANACKDKTYEIAKKFVKKTIKTKRGGVSFARNLGAKMSNGKIFIFLDADTILYPNALEEIKNAFTSKYSIGTLKGAADVKKIYYYFIFFIRNLLHKIGFYKGSTGIIICTRKVFEKTNGFDENMNVRENRRFIKDCLAYGKYKYIGKTKIIISMRRYERKGKRHLAFYWIKLFIKSFFSNLYNETYAGIR